MSTRVAVHADSWLEHGDPTESRSGALASDLFEHHSEMVLSVCRSVLVDPAEAEDAMQQTFLYAYRSILATTVAAVVVGLIAIAFVWLVRPAP